LCTAKDRHAERSLWVIFDWGAASSTSHHVGCAPESGSEFRVLASVMTGLARNLIERFFNKIKQCRRVATRYDKLAANYLAFIQLASIRLWLRVNESTPWPLKF
jgi:hypothetical protein